MKRIASALVLLLFGVITHHSPLITSVSAAPVQQITLDVSTAHQDQGLTFLQAAAVELECVIRHGDDRPYRDLRGWTGYFYYGSSATATAFSVVSSTNVNRGAGSITFSFSESDTNTNGTWLAYILLQDASSNDYWAGTIDLVLEETTATGSPGELALKGIYDWSGLTITNGTFTNATYYGDGSGLTGVGSATASVWAANVSMSGGATTATGTLTVTTNVVAEGKFIGSELESPSGTDITLDPEDGDVYVDGSLTVQGDQLAVTYDAAVGDDLDVTDDASIGGDLTMGGSASSITNANDVWLLTNSIGSVGVAVDDLQTAVSSLGSDASDMQDDIATNAADITTLAGATGDYVEVTGDTMTGDLVFDSNNISNLNAIDNNDGPLELEAYLSNPNGDLLIDDDLAVAQTLAVTGAATFVSTITAEDLASTDDGLIADDLIVGGDLTYSGTLYGVNADAIAATTGTFSEVTTSNFTAYTDMVLPSGVVDPADLADADFGDFTVSSGTATLDADTVTSNEIADASVGYADMAQEDHGDVTWESGDAVIEDDTIDSDSMADDDHGDVSWSGGTATVEAASGSFSVDGDLSVTGDVNASTNIAAAGTIEGLVTVVSLSTNRTWTMPELRGAVIFLSGVTTQTLPNVTATGYSVTFQCIDANASVVDADGSDSIRLDGTLDSAGDGIYSSGTAGDQITIISQTSTNWATVGRSGTWTAQ